MIRRLAADKRPKKQNLQMVQAVETRGPELPRRRPEHRRRRGAEVAPEGYSRPPRPDSCSSYIQERKDLVKTAQENVFIDSYYPKLQGDFSEDCESSEKSIAGFGGVPPNFLPSDSLGLGDSLESNSKTFRRRNATKLHGDMSDFHLDTSELQLDTSELQVDTSELHVGTSELLLNRKITDSERRTLQKSSRSRFTLDSRTYTLYSCASEVESVLSERQPINELAERKSHERSSIADKDVISAVDWFGQLHKRIEILEELLQQTLVNSFQQKREEKARTKQESKRKIKVETETPRPKTGIPDTQRHAAGESLDTDVELRNIKKRVRALEMKLKRTKASHGYKPALEVQEPCTNSLVFPDIESYCCCRRYQCGEPSESETSEPQRIVDLFESPRCEVEEEKVEETTIGEKRSKVKQKFIAKCKRIKGMCSSVISFSGKSSRSNNHFVQISEEYNRVSYKKSIVTEESLDEAFHRHSFPAQFEPEQTENATLVYLECQRENTMRKRRKGNLRKRKELCRKTPKTSFIMNRVGNWEERDEVQMTQSEEMAKSSSSGYEDLRWRIRSDFKFNPRKFNTDYKPKASKKLIRNPIDILRKGGRIKIPVLFREICKTSKSVEPAQKMSSISIRFVLVEKDSKHPLRKLVKKLSMGRSPERKEQYVFGVSKCSCNDETAELSTIHRRKLVKDFTYG